MSTVPHSLPSDERQEVAKAKMNTTGLQPPLMVPPGETSLNKGKTFPYRHAGCLKECQTAQEEANHAESCGLAISMENSSCDRKIFFKKIKPNPNNNQTVADFVEWDQAKPGKHFTTFLIVRHIRDSLIKILFRSSFKIDMLE